MSFKKVFKRNELHEVVNIAVLKEIVKNWDKYESRIVKTMIMIMTTTPKIFVRNI